MIIKIIFRNLLHKPLNALLSLLLLALSVAIISLLLMAGTQINQKLDNDLRDIDMVVGAKGSPLQLVLSAVYHVDAPTGNISEQKLMELAKNPMIEKIYPLSYGDSYKGYRILGTDTGYVQLYGGTLAKGSLFFNDMDALIGANVAARTGLKMGMEFHGTHGESEAGETHDHADYKVCGILAPTGTVLDNLILTTTNSVWLIHHPHHDEEDTGEDAHEEKETVHDSTNAHLQEEHHEKKHLKEQNHNSHDEGEDHHNHEHEMTKEKEITAALVKFRSPMGIMTFPRMINTQTNMQAAVPALEINRLLNLMGVGISALQGIAFAIMLIAGLSVFVSLYNRLKDRRYENALIRSMGGSRGFIFSLLLAEGFLLSILGFCLGILLSRIGITLLNKVAQQDYRFTFNTHWVSQEGWLLGMTILIGIFAVIMPALKAYRLNIAKTLSDG